MSPRSTAEDMVALARAQHLKATKATLREWVRIGLVGKPRRGRWTSRQLDIWIRLLREKQSGADIAGLCNVPVGGSIDFREVYEGKLS